MLQCWGDLQTIRQKTITKITCFVGLKRNKKKKEEEEELYLNKFHMEFYYPK